MAETPGRRPRAVLLDVMPRSSRRTLADTFAPAFDMAFAREADRSDLRGLVAGATVLLAMWGAVDAGLIEAAAGARVIQKLGVGTDKIDTEAAGRHGMSVLRLAGVNAEAVAEATVLLTLAVSRHLVKAVNQARAGTFDKERLRAEAFQLAGRTVGLFGFGHIGEAAAVRFAGFGVDVVYHDIVRAPGEVEARCGVRYVSFEELLSRSDVLSLHAPSTPQTRGRFGAEAFRLMKPGAILINTARGALVDEEALAAAIGDGRLLGAGLDVTQEEPLDPASPLLSLDRVVVTPHIAGAVGDNFPRVARRAYENVTAVLAGRPVPAADVVIAGAGVPA